MTAYIFRELTPATWPDFERLFRGPGGNDHCWCMYYRRGQSAAKEAAEYRVKRDGFPEHNRRRNEALVREGRSHGILVYEEGVPIGWCAYGRADEFPAIDRGRFYRRLAPPPRGIWRIACFIVARGHRRRGVATAALRGALEAIRDRGGGLVEAYPVAVPKTGSNTLWFGTVGMFEREGFEKVARLGASVLMRKVLPGRRRAPQWSRQSRSPRRKH